VERARLTVFVFPFLLFAEAVAAQERPPAPPAETTVAPEAARGEPGPAAPAPEEEGAGAREGPTPGAPTLSLEAAVRLALEQNFALLDSVDAVASAGWQVKAAQGTFYPQLVPLYQRSDDTSVFGLDVQQRLPWTGGTVTATGRYTSQPAADAPYPRTTNLRLLLSQPLLRGFGPNATYFELKNAKRARTGQERSLELARQRLTVQVASAYYGVIAQRQLLDVARQSLRRTESLRRASDARLQVGMASKLDVFRAELQAAQARDSMVRSQAALESALEQFRGLLALAPDDPVEPAAASLPEPRPSDVEPVAVLVARALDNRLELKEARDQVDDAQRAASLARQNLLPELGVNLGVTQLGYGGSFGDAWSAGDRRVEFFLSASYPLRRSTEKANRAVAELDLGARERAVRQRELEIEQDVRAAARELDRIRKSVEVQQAAVDVAEQQRRLAVLRYQRGLGSNFDVVDAEASLVVARSAVVGLLTSYAVARLDLQRATGTLTLETAFTP
jgi:outer membrane protein